MSFRIQFHRCIYGLQSDTDKAGFSEAARDSFSDVELSLIRQMNWLADPSEKLAPSIAVYPLLDDRIAIQVAKPTADRNGRNFPKVRIDAISKEDFAKLGGNAFTFLRLAGEKTTSNLIEVEIENVRQPPLDLGLLRQWEWETLLESVEDANRVFIELAQAEPKPNRLLETLLQLLPLETRINLSFCSAIHHPDEKGKEILKKVSEPVLSDPETFQTRLNLISPAVKVFNNPAGTRKFRIGIDSDSPTPPTNSPLSSAFHAWNEARQDLRPWVELLDTDRDRENPLDSGQGVAELKCLLALLNAENTQLPDWLKEHSEAVSKNKFLYQAFLARLVEAIDDLQVYSDEDRINLAETAFDKGENRRLRTAIKDWAIDIQTNPFGFMQHFHSRNPGLDDDFIREIRRTRIQRASYDPKANLRQELECWIKLLSLPMLQEWKNEWLQDERLSETLATAIANQAKKIIEAIRSDPDDGVTWTRILQLALTFPSSAASRTGIEWIGMEWLQRVDQTPVPDIRTLPAGLLRTIVSTKLLRQEWRQAIVRRGKSIETTRPGTAALPFFSEGAMKWIAGLLSAHEEQHRVPTTEPNPDSTDDLR